jgi:cysteine desulfurase
VTRYGTRDPGPYVDFSSVSVYLDHAATTPMLPAAVEAMAEQAARVGNASSLHTSGRAARAVVEESRERIAAALGAGPSEVVFTSGGTEADNLAVKGSHTAAVAADPARRRVVASGIEHHAVLDPVVHLCEHQGAAVTWLEPDRCGYVAADHLRSVLEQHHREVSLVTVMWANNEMGTVQPIPELAAVAHEYGVPLHTDAVQAVGHLRVHFGESGVDLMTVSAHKVGGPLGVGALLARRDARVMPLVHGGGQERQVRSGTPDVPGIRAFAVAVEATVATRDVETKRVLALRDRLAEGAVGLGLGITMSGCWRVGDAEGRLANNAHLLVPGCEGDSLLYLLDAAGVECSTGSACQAGVPQPSHVLLAMGYPQDQARGALRLSLGSTSTEADVDAFLAVLPAVVERARRAGRAS